MCTYIETAKFACTIETTPYIPSSTRRCAGYRGTGKRKSVLTRNPASSCSSYASINVAKLSSFPIRALARCSGAFIYYSRRRLMDGSRTRRRAAREGRTTGDA
ncbi:hypothetical protein EVAR_63376_1 [Eumeta japonica]|uniref:Uncharacterized protein n=1 Tax=Eumeta variegata TaxID=151549 RepID=A0A4C1YVS1_EUMVA|nr:hypothetical protein EVAR_63376_1 [Eumeta japonica]